MDYVAKIRELQAQIDDAQKSGMNANRLDVLRLELRLVQFAALLSRTDQLTAALRSKAVEMLGSVASLNGAGGNLRELVEGFLRPGGRG